MTIKELLGNTKVQEALIARAPKSQYSGHPLFLIRIADDAYQFENSSDREWWEGAETGVYKKQIRIAVTPMLLRDAAIAAGQDADSVELAIAVWEAELDLAKVTTTERLATVLDEIGDMDAELFEVAKVDKNVAWMLENAPPKHETVQQIIEDICSGQRHPTSRYIEGEGQKAENRACRAYQAALAILKSHSLR